MSIVEQLWDRQQIADVLTRYTKAVDRCDVELLLATWALGATLDYGSGEEDAAEWSRGLLTRLAGMERTQHALSNMLVTLDGDTARAETVCTAYHLIRDGEGLRRMIVGGRYLDELARQPDGDWRVRRRRYVIDWNETEASTCHFDKGFARFARVGRRWPQDASYD